MVVSKSDDKNFFKNFKINYVVYDEGHMLKNCSTERYKSLMKIKFFNCVVKRYPFTSSCKSSTADDDTCTEVAKKLVRQEKEYAKKRAEHVAEDLLCLLLELSTLPERLLPNTERASVPGQHDLPADFPEFIVLKSVLLPNPAAPRRQHNASFS
ncbi:unnamed protein product, partial [Mesorhabditis belari]|uniref:Uncharacterized protein n=1 Tax=Mesorhabditis belari TaxID=2138241 RepID=A0AAF3FMP8_9BILA